MGKIRNNHNSPGVYFQMTDIPYPWKYKKHIIQEITINSSNGNVKPYGPWVFGDLFPAIFS